MTPDQVDRFFNHLDHVDAASKELDALPTWELVTHRPSGNLLWQAAVRLNGRLGGGASILLSTPVGVWENDLYGQITVRSADTLNKAARLNPIEWRPRRRHTNPPAQAEEHSLQTLDDRWHPYDINRPLGPDVFLQKCPGIAVPLPASVIDFVTYLDFCGQVWKCPSIKEVPPPPWSPQMI